MVGISGIQGCYYNVMGLPVARLFEELKKIAG
jgi:predicted house-cleaning NTP pyrophosphatase (Maf/HAM1 superfamily)